MTWSLTQSASGYAHGMARDFAMHGTLAEEVPVAMVFDGSSQAVMMASPGDIADLALGFALTEGIIESPDQVDAFEEVVHDNGIEARFRLREDRRQALEARRRFMAGPVGCGLCGIESLDQAIRALPAIAGDTGPVFSRTELAGATDALRAVQSLYDRTHATHAAGFLRPGQGIVMAREDVGRHNALDKLIGALTRQGTDAAQGAFVMTSRLSVELVQKCAFAGCACLIAVSAPTAHAVRLAEEAGITLTAFARNGGFQVHAHPHRVATGDREMADVA